ncbi:aldose 1-epimerase [Brevundimonas intermedia]|uniref:Aldose 1-epimerase n=1 Tax=Brevundimonas intermedia TaxID=74315 RepID=A0A4Y9RSR6_9CAUL|nr:aldose 1-epimerase [Brevundimonas intermedia]TFW12327.1 aldose 1-epimerase [Brevundimonas intermedia]
MIRLEAGGWRATVAPEQGGAVLSLDWQGQPVFRPTPDGATDILETACFPLVPYANRIADGRFVFEGRSVQLPTLERFAPHALHGDGWLLPWTVESETANRVEMSLDWPGDADGWPWPWRARQIVELTDQGLSISLSMTNTGDAVMPAGLGLHPYFHRYSDSRLTLVADQVWITDAREIPERLAPSADISDWSNGLALADTPFVDHAYAGWSGEAVLDGGGRQVTLTADAPARWTQIYAPVGVDFFCVEPVTHRPDAHNAPAGECSGLLRLRPDDRLSIAMTVSGQMT